MSASLFIGVDGGGTNCRARIRDDDGKLLGEGLGGPANVRLGEAGWRSVIEACEAAAAKAGLTNGDLARAHAGLGLAGAVTGSFRSTVLERTHPFASLTLDSDAYAALLGACPKGHGAILILGTGSAGLAEIHGQRFTVGGFGAEIGDEASGCWIGREALRRAVHALDGLAEMTPFAEAVLARFERDGETIIEFASDALPADFAALAPLAFDFGEAGDPLASGILRQAGSDAGAMVRRLIFFGAPTVCLLGGLATRLTPWLEPALQEKLAPAAGDALDGAILMARRHAANLGSSFGR